MEKRCTKCKLMKPLNAFRGRMSDVDMLKMARALIAKADLDSTEPSWNSYMISSESMVAIEKMMGVHGLLSLGA